MDEVGGGVRLEARSTGGRPERGIVTMGRGGGGERRDTQEAKRTSCGTEEQWGRMSPRTPARELGTVRPSWDGDWKLKQV